MRYSISRDTFWTYVDQSGEGCWPWHGNHDKHGYGTVSMPGMPQHAHRVAYLLTYGTIPAGYHVHHVCKTPICCNPSHLLPLSASDHRKAHVGPKRIRIQWYRLIMRRPATDTMPAAHFGQEKFPTRRGAWKASWRWRGIYRDFTDAEVIRYTEVLTPGLRLVPQGRTDVAS